MGEPGRDWGRCGNTPYYRSGEDLTWLYVDPLKFRLVSVGTAIEGSVDEGAISVIYGQAPEYNFDMLQNGAALVTNDRQAQHNMILAVREWAIDLFHAKRAGTKDAGLRKMFESAPKDVQMHVLNGIQAMMIGYGDAAMRNPERSEIKTQIVMVIPKFSQAEKKLEVIEDIYGDDLKLTIVDDSISQGLDMALAEFGIYEC